MPKTYPPFTIHEAEFRLYLADSQGVLLGQEVYLGGCLENLEINAEYESIPLKPHGVPFGGEHHVDEKHTLRIENLWCMNPGTGLMPEMRHRNRNYVLSLIWHDMEKRTWCKMVFRGVRSGGHRFFSGEAFSQDQLFVAASFDEPETGVGNPPNFLPSSDGVVRYVTELEDLALYRYNFATGHYSPISPALLSARAEILPGAGDFRIRFTGTDALVVYPNQIHVHEQSAAADEWPVTHSFGVPPLVFIFDENGERLLASVKVVNGNQLTVSHLDAITGEVRCHRPQFVHVQSSPSAIWEITHPLAEQPEVQVIDSTGEWVVADISHPTPGVIQVEFYSAETGTALVLGSPGIRVKEITALGGAFPLGPAFPRLEFWRGAQRVGSLTAAGELCVPKLEEVIAAAEDAEDFEFRVNNLWHGGLSPGKARGFEFLDTL